MKQTILVTGASSGFGLLIAQKLHDSGHHVIGTSRNPKKYIGKLYFEKSACRKINWTTEKYIVYI